MGWLLMLLVAQKTVESPPHKVALLELYTSEGCSSCPPADRWLNQIAVEPERVIPLALHVDYWDSLGWPDPFAQRAFSERQAKRSHEVYTPETLLDGREWRARDQLKEAVRAVNAQPAQAKITLTVAGRSARAQLSTQVAGAQLFLAVWQDGLEVEVPRGENAGRRLRHEHVVRQFVAGRQNAAELALPERADGVAAFAESPDGEILQAVALPLR
jgi:hypothetical protein